MEWKGIQREKGVVSERRGEVDGNDVVVGSRIVTHQFTIDSFNGFIF